MQSKDQENQRPSYTEQSTVPLNEPRAIELDKILRRGSYKRAFARVATADFGDGGMIWDRLSEKYPDMFNEDNRPKRPDKKIQLIDILILKVFAHALFDPKPLPYIREVFDRLYGKPHESQSVHIEQDQPSQQPVDEIQRQIDELRQFASIPGPATETGEDA